MKVTACVLLGLLSGINWMMAAENTPPAASEQMRPHGRSERMMRRGGAFMEQLKSKYPTETAEIEKLRSSDPNAARQKMRELMRKAGGDGMLHNMRPGNPPGDELLNEEQKRVLKSKYPEDFAEYEKLKSSDPAAARKKLQQLIQKAESAGDIMASKNLRDRNRRSVQHIRATLKRRYPDRYAEIEKKAVTDPDAARAELRKLFAESELLMPPGASELIYEYQDPKLKNHPPGNMRSPRNFPFGGGMMMGPPGFWGRRN